MITNYWLWLAILFNALTNMGFKYASMVEGNPKKKWLMFSGGLVFGLFNSICFTECLKTIPLNLASAIFFSMTIVSLTVISYVVFNEEMNWTRMAGIGVIVAGVFIVNMN